MVVRLADQLRVQILPGQRAEDDFAAQVLPRGHKLGLGHEGCPVAVPADRRQGPSTVHVTAQPNDVALGVRAGHGGAFRALLVPDYDPLGGYCKREN